VCVKNNYSCFLYAEQDDLPGLAAVPPIQPPLSPASTDSGEVGSESASTLGASDMENITETDTDSDGGLSDASTACYEELSDCNYALDLQDDDDDTDDDDDGGWF